MSVLGYRARNRPQQVARRGPNPEIDDRATTPELFGEINRRFHLTIDVCAHPHNAKLPRYFTPEDDGLAQSWAGERVWCNPPFSDIRPWVEKAWSETQAHIIVMLLPANRTEQGWWQDLVESRRLGGRDWMRTEWWPPLTVEFMPGRPRFIRAGAQDVKPNERPPFGLVLLVWRPYDYLTKAQVAAARGAA